MAENENGGGGGGAALDYGVLTTALKPENAEVWNRKGFATAGEGGKPDINAVFDAYRGLEGLVGKNNLAPPDMSGDDPFKGWDAGRKALGIVEDGTKIKLTRKDMPKGADGKPIAYSEAGEKFFREAITGVIPEKYAQRLFDKFQDFQIANAGALAQGEIEDRQATDAFVAKEWGAQKDMKLARAGVIANRIAEKIGVDPADLKTDSNAFLGSTAMLKLFDFLADQFGEGFIKDGGAGSDANNENTPAGAKATLDRLKQDKDFNAALNDSANAGHAAAVARRNKLAQTAYGN